VALTRLSSPRDFFKIWFFWKYHALFIFFIIIIIVSISIIIKKPIYEAEAKILILPRTTEGLIISAGSEVERIETVSREDINTEIELLNSEDVIRDTVTHLMEQGKDIGTKAGEVTWYTRVIKFLKGVKNSMLAFLNLRKPLSTMDANVKLLENSIEVEPVAMSNIILVKLRSENPEQSATLLNQLLNSYIKHHNEVFSKDDGIAFFNDQANEYRKQLEQAEEQLKDLQSQWQIIDLETQFRTKIGQLSELDRELKLLEVSIDETEAKLAMLRKGLRHGIELTKEMRFIPSIVELEKALVPLYVERSEILKSFTESSREYQNVNHQINSINQQIKSEVIKAVKTEELELNSLRAKQSSLRKKIAATQAEADKLIQRERFLNELNRKITLLQENYILYASKAEDARINSERIKRKLANVSIAERATVPSTASFPRTNVILMIALVIACFTAIGVPFILEFFDHRIKTSQEIENILSLPVICTLPEVKNHGSN
jgi:uncharacterized protein involved in exopolysaccharide biosynthesis